MGSGTLSEIIVCEHSSLRHPEMQVKALSCKEEDMCEHDPDMLSLDQSSLKMRPKWKTVLWLDESKFEILYGNHGQDVLWIPY